MARLSARARRALPKSDFAIKSKAPKSGSYPLPDEKHARSALSLVSQHGSPEEKAKVRAAVKARFKNIKVGRKKK